MNRPDLRASVDLYGDFTAAFTHFREGEIRNGEAPPGMT